MISALSLALLFTIIDLQALGEALRLADYRYIPPALIAFLVSLAARDMAWRTLLLNRVSFWKVYFTLNEGYLLNNILPFRLGELGRAFLLSRTTPLEFWQVFSTILIERAFDMAISAGMLLATLPFVLGAGAAGQVAAAVIGVIILGLVALHLLARQRDWALARYEQAGSRFPVLHRFGRSRVEAFLDGLVTLNDPARFAQTFGWMLIVWSLTLVQYTLVLRAFVPDAPLLWGAFGLGVAALGVAIPSSPGNVGVLHAALVGALSLFGIDPAVAFAYAITVHLLFVSITGVLGVYGLMRDGLSIGSLYRQVQSEADRA